MACGAPLSFGTIRALSFLLTSTFFVGTCEAARQRSAPEHVTTLFSFVYQFSVCSCVFLFCFFWGLGPAVLGR
ncbi:hypothetical protein [Blackfly microvirus SF02]|uniref:Uncharacterized protein n=1 Tax=Blackfly microvirus SF02 TaxID=2576452 RepID=A0A4P8PPF7_9VIRU|nr:hypothetical protein [Blackfly microvirus SF02]QCQ84833.1 hypothetical protein [Blackfly microvirus SF02]